QQLYSDGCELDSQRQSFEPDADVPDQGGIVVGQVEIGFDCPSPVDEEQDSRRLSDKCAILGRRRWRGERRDGPLGLPTQMKRLTAGDEDLQCGTEHEEVRDEPCSRDYLLEVIQHERQLPYLEIQLKGFDQWLVAGVANPEGLGNRSG